jgi:two-component system, OmpR family, KDP operon response regulator KdpE
LRVHVLRAKIVDEQPDGEQLSAAKVLIVDDDPRFRRAMRKVLASEGYEVTEAPTGQRALETLRHSPRDLVLLDIVMPGMSGLDICRAVREFSDVPVLVVSVRNLEQDKIDALDAGADDYVTKPFSLPELLARARAALRRMPLADDTPHVLHLGDVEVNFVTRRLTAGGREIRLTRKEFDLLQYLASHPDTCLSHSGLLQAIWGPEYSGAVIYLRVLVRQLRKKIEPDPHHPRYIVSDHALGYRLVLTPRESP